jgi:hypothetical protein
MNYSQKVKFLPWVGKNYGNNENEPKILILGLSTYDRDPSEGRTTSQLIAEYARDGGNGPFVSRIRNVFSHEGETPKDLWDRVAFTNYIQRVMSESGERNTAQDWEEAKEPFWEVCKKIKPDIVAAVSFTMYDRLPEGGELYKSMKHKEDSMEIWKYDIDERSMYVCKMRHPAAYEFRAEAWQKLFSKFEKIWCEKLRTV